MNDNNPANEFYFQWHFIEKCNLRCVHCYQENHNQNELPQNDLFLIANKMENALKKWGKIGRISLTGGEPFTRPDLLVDLVSFFDQSNYFGRIGILTNGTLIDDDIAAKLSSFNKLHEIQVSIDGSNTDVHDEIRGNGSFSKALRGIKMLKEHGFFVSIMFTLNKLNQDDVLNVIDLAQKHNVDAITIERVTPMNFDDIMNLYINAEKLHDVYNDIYLKKQIIEENSDLKIRVSRPLWTLLDETIGGFCPTGYTSLCILHDGTVLPCRRLEIPLGNILTDGLYKIWYTSDILWKIRNKKLLAGKCNGCTYIQNCGGCRAIAYHISGDYMGEDPQCWKNN